MIEMSTLARILKLWSNLITSERSGAGGPLNLVEAKKNERGLS